MNKLPAICFCLVAALALASTRVAAAEVRCNIKRGNEVVRITKVIDGDTVITENNDRVRLIGINTPEKVSHKKRTNPLAEEAKVALEKWVLDKRVLLEYDEERTDHFDRVLAHLHDRRGNINARLVRQGFAWQAVVPPNLKHLDCYFEQERLAREELLGIWQYSEYDAVPADPYLLDPQLGFLRVRGTVAAVEQRAKSTWLQFGKRISARIRDEHVEYFADIDLQQLAGEEIIVRGWVFSLQSHRVAYPSVIVEIDHPLMIENLDSLVIPPPPENIQLLTY